MQLSQRLLQGTQLKILQLPTLLEKFTVGRLHTSNVPSTFTFPLSQWQQLKDVTHKLSCDMASFGPDDKLNSYSSLRLGSNVPQFRMLSTGPSRQLVAPAFGLHYWASHRGLWTRVCWSACPSSRCELPKGRFMLHSLTHSGTKKCFPWVLAEWKLSGFWLARYSSRISLPTLGLLPLTNLTTGAQFLTGKEQIK